MTTPVGGAACDGAAAPSRTFLVGKELATRLNRVRLPGAALVAQMRAAVIPALRLAADVSHVDLYVARADKSGQFHRIEPPLRDADTLDAVFPAEAQPFVCVVASECATSDGECEGGCVVVSYECSRRHRTVGKRSLCSPADAAASATAAVGGTAASSSGESGGSSGSSTRRPHTWRLLMQHAFASAFAHTGPPGFPAALRAVGAASDYTRFDSAAALARLPADTPPYEVLRDSSWLADRVVGDRIGLSPAPVPVELMEPALAECIACIKHAKDCSLPRFARAAAAARRLQCDRSKLLEADADTARGLLVSSFRAALSELLPGITITSASRGCSVVVAFRSHVWTVLQLVVELNEHPAAQNDAQAWLRSAMADHGGVLHLPAALSQGVPNQPLFQVDVYGGRVVELRASAWAGPCLCTESIATAPLRSAEGSEGRKQLVRLLHGLAAGVKHLYQRYARAAEALSRDAALLPVRAPRRHELVHPDIIAAAAAAVCAGCTITLNGELSDNVFTGIMVRPPRVAAPAGAAASTAARLTTSNDGGSTTDVVVKVCRQYECNVHVEVAARGFAPALHGRAVVGDWMVIVMDLLSCDWRPLARSAGAACSAAVVDCAAEAYGTAFAVTPSGARFVHGDARGPNIMCRPSAAAEGRYDIMFVDFEFAGVECEARYPLSLNPEAFEPVVARVAACDGCEPEEVELAGMLIRQEYDLALIEAMRPP